MNFDYTEDQKSILEAVSTVCSNFDDAYWLKRDQEGGFPVEFYDAMAAGGWLGICVPEEYGGSGLGVTEAAIMARAIAESGAGMSGASAVHTNIFGLNPVVVYGTEEQKQRMLRPMAEGKEKACFAVTEPNTGLNTTQLKTRAVRDGNKYIVDGQKVWISTAQVADKILLLARTTPLEEVEKASHGLSLFYTDLDRSKIKIHEIEKMGRKAVDSNELFIEGFEIPVEDRIGEEGRGFEYILHGMTVNDTTLGTTVGNLGMSDVKFPKPVFHGDTLRAHTKIISVRESKSREDVGLVEFEHTATNQRDEVVAICRRVAMMRKRSAA
jgi:acyl-CoA dehydrogenase